MKKLEMGSVLLLDTLTLISILKASQTEVKGLGLLFKSGQSYCNCKYFTCLIYIFKKKTKKT